MRARVEQFLSQHDDVEGSAVHSVGCNGHGESARFAVHLNVPFSLAGKIHKMNGPI
jgi:hypothetical protein